VEGKESRRKREERKREEKRTNPVLGGSRYRDREGSERWRLRSLRRCRRCCLEKEAGEGQGRRLVSSRIGFEEKDEAKLTELHVNRSELNPALNQTRHDSNGLLEVLLRPVSVVDEEPSRTKKQKKSTRQFHSHLRHGVASPPSIHQPDDDTSIIVHSLESTPQVESLGLSLGPGDTLSESLLSERERVLMVSSLESLESEDQGRVGLG